MRKIGLVVSFLGASLLAAPALASGPVERLVQLLVHPSVPNVLAVRYAAGAGSHGFLFSRDGGQSFQLMCSAVVLRDTAQANTVQRISQRLIPATAATALDGAGAVVYSQFGSSWGDDGTGCTWNSVPELADRWPFGLKADPADSQLLWAAVSTPPASANERETFELWQRDGTKVWKSKGPIRPVDSGRAVQDASLVVSARGMARTLYASLFVRGAMSASEGYVMRSDDDGATWEQHVLPKEQEQLNLLAVDPMDANVLIAAISRDGSADTLLISKNGGASFEDYAELRAVGAVTFDAAGRIFVGDIGDASGTDTVGGLFKAARVGEPLVRVGQSAGIDCVQSVGDKLYVCAGEVFGTIDIDTGVIKELIQIKKVDQFISCAGKDLRNVCQDQLNAGPSWCCAGHYPFTPLCDEYNVTKRPDGGRVFCGLAGREYDSPNVDAGSADASVDAAMSVPDGNVTAPPDASTTPDASTPAKDGKDGGCRVATTCGNADLALLLIAALALWKRSARLRRT